MPRTVPRGARCQRCVRARFGRILGAMRFVRCSSREVARFASGFARCGEELYCLHSFEFWAPRLSFDPRCTGQIGKFTGQIPESRVFSKFESNAKQSENSARPARVNACAQKWPCGLEALKRAEQWHDSRSI